MSEDLIRRSDAIKALYKYSFVSKDIIEKEINAIPSADRPPKVVAQITFDEEKLREIVKEAVERFKEEYEITDRPQGEWIEQEDCWQCSECGDEYVLEVGVKPIDAKMHFCPNCGARMKGAGDERGLD